MSLNTFGDINLFPHNTDIFYPIGLGGEEGLDNDSGVDDFTLDQQKYKVEDLMPKEPSYEIEYGEGLDQLADETIEDDPYLLDTK